MAGRLAGKVAIVTGGGSGFGEGICQLYAAEGASVVVNDVNQAAAVRVADAIQAEGGTAMAYRADVTDDMEVGAMVAKTVETYGGLDIMVNNAGITHLNQPMLDVTEAEFDRVFAVNVKSIFLAARHVVPVMRGQGGGVIINTASTAGIRPRPGLTWYNGSKGAAITLTKSMAAELAPDNIRVNALCPVVGATGLLEAFMGAKDTPELRQKFISTIPLGRMSTPADIANAALYFAEDSAAFITGVAMEIDGGRCI